MNIGDKIENFFFQATNGLQNSLEQYRGQWVVLYFYPKDATPGCTVEGCDFRDQSSAFHAMNAVIFGVSRDGLKSHENFKSKQQFPFDLISDADEHLCQQFAVIKMKSMYGKQVRGIERSTFLIDPSGVLRYEWRQVKVKDHVSNVLSQLKALADAVHEPSD